MLYFGSDYLEGAHPLILKRLTETNMEQTPGYGTDHYSETAKQKIRDLFGCPEAEVEFMVGGTQTNATMIAAMLRLYEGVIAADTGHICVHEAGAIEAGGHKVLALPHCEGKLKAEEVDRYVTQFYNDPSWEHEVAPGMVYISYPTELGTLYTLSELKALSMVCRKHHLPLYLDGARLAYGLTAPGNDITMKDIAALCDVFYIGGTKVGALFGEAVVIPNPRLIKQLPTIIKQRGVLLAKGRLLGLQFDTLFTDDLYLSLGRHANQLSTRIAGCLKEKGYSFYMQPQSNQLFILLENRQLEDLSQNISFGLWERPDAGHTIVRIATSWATSEEHVDALLRLM